MFFYSSFLVLALSILFNRGKSSPISFIKRETNFESLPLDLKGKIAKLVSPHSGRMLAATSKNFNSTVTDYVTSSFTTHLNMLNLNCPKWIVRNATENPWFIFTPITSDDSKFNKTCLKSLNDSVDSISRIKSLDLSHLVFDDESLFVLDDLLKRKTFSSITCFIWNDNVNLINRLFRIFGQAKGIESLTLVEEEVLPSSKSVDIFIQYSKTKHLTISVDMFNLLAPHGSQLETLESISIISNGPLDIGSIESFPNLNSFYAQDFFKQIMKAKNQIKGVSLSLNHRSPQYIGIKKLKSLVLGIYQGANQNNVIDVLLNSKDTLKSIDLQLFTSYSFANEFFHNNRFLKHLSVSVTSPNDEITFSNINLNLTTLFYSGQTLFGNFQSIIGFLNTQTHLSTLTYQFTKYTDENDILSFYKQICEIVRLNAYLKTVQLSLPHKLSSEFVREFVKLTKGIERTDFTMNSISVDTLVNLDTNQIPSDLRLITKIN